ncbi:MAG: hypothetical protein Q9163_001067 [Psora crenata]
MAARSKLDEARIQNELQVVKMDEVGYPRFRPGKSCLGTEDLNSCTAVIVVSKAAAILAHIPPRPPSPSSDRATGDDHAKTKMNELSVLLRQHLSDFKEGPGGVIVYAVYEGEVALKDQKTIIEAQFAAWKLPSKTATYQVLGRKENRTVGKGTVLIDARKGLPIVWVEDKHVAQISATKSPVAGSSILKTK